MTLKEQWDKQAQAEYNALVKTPKTFGESMNQINFSLMLKEKFGKSEIDKIIKLIISNSHIFAHILCGKFRLEICREKDNILFVCENNKIFPLRSVKKHGGKSDSIIFLIQKYRKSDFKEFQNCTKCAKFEIEVKEISLKEYYEKF